MHVRTHSLPTLPRRLASLDVFRGFAIAGMLIVNNPGTRQHMYPFLRHAGWTGCNFADLVFPFFLFIVGASAAFSLPGSSGGPQCMPPRMLRRIVRRALVLFSLGVMLNAFSEILLLVYAVPPDFSDIRVTGVLQRISITYLLLAFAVVYVSRNMLVAGSAVLLLLYWAALVFVPVPGHGPGVLTPEGNLALYVDRFILSPSHMYDARRLDPEGLCATLPAFVTVVIGYCTGKFMQARTKNTGVSLLLAAAGITSLAAGHLWGLLLPVSKDLWTGSFVLVSSGWSLLCMALCYEIIDVKGLHAIGLPFKVMGMNALALFIGSGLLSRVLLHIRTGAEQQAPSLWSAAHSTLCASWLSASNAGSLLFSLVYLAFWWVILYALYRRAIFIKI